MIKFFNKRLLSLLLAVLMIVSVMPLQAFAAESETHEHKNTDMEINPFVETVLLKEVKSKMDEILNKYLGKTVMLKQDVEDAVWSMDDDKLMSAWDDAEALAELAEPMTDAELYFLQLYESTETFCYFYEVLSEIFNPSISFFAASGTHTPVTGVTVSVSGASDNSMSNGAVTVTAKGSGGFLGIGASAKTATITIYNESGATATLSFDWTATSVNQLMIDGTVYGGASGNFSKVLDAGASFVVTITTAKNSTTNKLVMNNFAIVASKAESNVTFDYDSALGSVTVAGNAVSDGSAVTISKDGATLVATPVSGATFLGWIDMATHKIISKTASFTLQPADNMTVKPVFANTAPWFLVNADYLYKGLNEAMTAVASVANKTVVLANNGTLPAGNYIIPKGVTLLIPYDATNTLYTTAPGTTEDSYKQPTAYRTLTMAAGANITVNGAISVSAMQTAASGLSAPTNSAGFIKMESGSTITVNSGANLYAWGFIMGSGAITVKSGGTVYECFQVSNWRGGTNVSDMVDNKQGVFPMSQYYIQNVEVPMTLEAGAVENGYMSVYISMIGVQGSAVPFIGPNGMFNIKSGSVTKDYDETSDRLNITIDGEIGMQSLSITMKLGLLGSKTINSSKYELPVNSNITVCVKDGGKITITQDIALLPGAEIIVEKGAECTFGKGNSIYIYDATEWTNTKDSNGNVVHFVTGTGDVAPVKYAPGITMNGWHTANSDATIHIAGKVDASQGYVYVTASGANITAEDGAVVLLNPGTQKETHQVHQTGSDGKTLNYYAIPINNVQLGETNNLCGGTYEYVNGVWMKNEYVHAYAETTTPAGCITDGLKTFNCLCGNSYTEAIPATGHTPGAEATCTNPQTCTVCGEEIAPVEGHAPGAEATCTNPQTCTVCGEELAPATGHTPGAEATCTTAQTCTVCGEELTPAKGHTPGEEADCTTAQTCTVCGEVLNPAGGHTEVIDEAKAPTCTETGLTEGKHCSVCGEVLVAQTVVDALGHTEVIDAAKDSTCTATGLTEGKHCSVCGEILVSQNVVAVKPHTPGAEATCTTAQKCTVCGNVLVDKLGHKWQDVPAKAPGRTENGYEAYKACEECGEIDGEIVIIPALGEAEINSYEELLFNLTLLEEIAGQYVKENPGKNPIALVIKYIRTGVDRYNSGSWGIMAGSEDTDFANYVRRMEDMANAEVTDGKYVAVTGLKNINNFYLPNGDYADIGHVFGAMDITYHNKGSQNHADVSGWAGDLVDLLELSDMKGVTGDLDVMIKNIAENILCKDSGIANAPTMSQEDIDGDLDAYYIMYALYEVEEDYTAGTLTEILENYFTEDLTIEQRAAFFLRNRLETTGTRAQIRNAVYTEYTGNKLIATLEGTREFKTNDLSTLRRAVCYAFADYLCKLAGDYVEKNENIYYEVFNSSMSVLAPGITQEYYQATSADGKQMVYYVATADITRDDVHVFANYNNAAPEDGWAMQRVLDQANAAQDRYGDPNSPDYIPNYNVIVSTNADGYDMTTGEPGGLLIMNGNEWHGIGNGGFFGITKDGKAVIGTKDDYNNIYRNQLTDAVGGFGTMLIRDGKIAVSRTETYYTDRAPRTAVGITKTGKVVLMVLDGRQEPYSCGGSMQEIAQILFEAGCVNAVNLDGGGSTTFVVKQQGEEELTVMNRPSDGAARSVSTSLLMVSTAPSSTAFDHANLVSTYNYATIGTPVKITPVGISATGNITDLPEGYTWAVSDERWATISEDGVFTGLRNGSVEVYLMLDGAVIGSKTMNIVVPESVYFTKNPVDAVYGSTIQLPIAALYEGKQVAISADDVKIVIDNAQAGTVDGFAFTAVEGSGVKVVKITATLEADPSISGLATVNLYKQGENSFDFDKATGGDRLLAWDRVVSNATTDDGMAFVAIDTNEDMVTSYTFAMDMTQIPIPTQLTDLVYMLPGADMADASAWNFLLQLAERVSTLTEVTPVLRFDPNVEVDYSELKIKNDYFELTGTEFDEATNTLTLKLRWIDQTAAIDPATANPLCLVSGIKLTPKDNANWDANKRLNQVHTGAISYKIYLRANALYSFAQKPENQQIFGLLPFVNPEIPSESGAYFSNVYKEFEDSYTLVNALKNGWYAEDGGFAYYIQGVKMAGGVKKVEGYYYYFNDQGINIGQNKYTGIFHSPSEGAYYYAKVGTLEGGWQSIDGDWYYFDKTTLKAVSGQLKLSGVTYEFEANGKLKSGVWMNVFTGWRYYYGPDYYRSKWQEIDGEWYYFRDGIRVTGQSEVTAPDNVTIRKWYEFDENGVSQGPITGIVNKDGVLYWCEDGKFAEKFLFKYNGDYYYSRYNGQLVVNEKYYAYKVDSSCDLPVGTYEFGPDGKMLGVGDESTGGASGIVEIDGVLYYYEYGKPVEKFLFQYNGGYYYSRYNGQLVVNDSYYAYKVDSSCDLPAGTYEFGPDGKMLHGIVEKNGELYYYEYGKGIEKGLFFYDGYYYCAKSNGKLAVNESYYTYKIDGSCNLPKSTYDFDENGRLMLNGIVNKNGVLYFYENGKPVEKGLFMYEGNYYYSRYNGSLIVNEKYYAYKLDSSSKLPAGHYEFGADGKMLNGIVDKSGVLYFYENGNPKEKYLFEYNGDYYYSRYNGQLVVNDKYYAYKVDSSCNLPVGTYEFGSDGKMLQGIVDKNGVLYFYENGNPVEKFLFEYNGDYYYSRYNGQLVVDDKYYAYKVNSNCDLPVGHYEFGADGKMLQGIIEKNGVLYFYENGKPVEKGLFMYEGNYYYTRYNGALVVDATYYAYIVDDSCDLPVGNYYFDASGKMLYEGIVEKDGVLYYYENGKPVDKGLFILDGYYYYARYDGKIITNQTYYVWKTNDHLLEKNYIFDEYGHIIG